MSSTSDARTPGRIITFYSYKGGTGRSMALANVACLLARGVRGHSGQSATPDQRVLVIDWDLEAPGLHRYFGPFLADSRPVATWRLVRSGSLLVTGQPTAG